MNDFRRGSVVDTADFVVLIHRKPKYIIFAIIIANIKKALVLKKYTNPAIKVLIEYYRHLKSFLQKKANKLLECQLYNYKIIIKEGKDPRFRPLYGIS